MASAKKAAPAKAGAKAAKSDDTKKAPAKAAKKDKK